MKAYSAFILLIILPCINLLAQPLSGERLLTHADTLRGTYGPQRDWWDVLKYDLHVKFNIADSTITGYNIIQFKPLKTGSTMQIDLQEPLILDSVTCFIGSYKVNLSSNSFTKDGNAYFINTPNLENQIPKINNENLLTIYYHGKPVTAKHAPWDGGLIWQKDKNNNPWVSIACQGMGASVWYPCKDHQSDEPDSAEMHITVPDTLVCVGNGRLRNKKLNGDGTATYDWAVLNPINNYNIIPYIGKYVHFGELYKGEKGKLDMDYWVLDYNLQKAKKQFTDASKMMKAFEYWFGPYPFYKDGYKLVESPHLGMEHQSAIAYGNGYQNGYLGKDLSSSGWGLKWDFIIVHESGHEWFANNITTKDIADMWVHEGFTNYSETLFTGYYYGAEASTAYISGIRKNIANDIPVIGLYNVNKEGSSDMYYKAANMLHNIRQVINNDSLFRKILRGLNSTFYHQTVTSKQVEEYVSQNSKIDFTKVFDQYLRTTQIPVLEYKIDKYKLAYRYTNCIKGFNMPLKIKFKTQQWIKPTEAWQTLNAYPEGTVQFSVDPNFYINTKKVD
ncbi:MAG: M1 family metallopeptidase [Ferruginibacter sp.]